MLLLLLVPMLAATSNVSPIDTLMADGHWKRARTAAEAEYKTNPKDARVVYRMARVRHAFGNLDEAARLIETAVSMDPKYPAAQREAGDIYCDQAEKASILRQMGLAHRCKAALEAALSLDPKDPASVESLVMYLVQAPGIAGGDMKRAHDLADALMKTDPGQGYLIQAQIAAKEKQESSLFYQKAVKADPANYAARVALAGYYIGPGHDLAQAEHHLNAAIEANPDRMRAWRLSAAVLAAQKRVDEIPALLAAAEAAIPDDLSPWFAAGNNLMQHNVDLPRAETCLKRYIADTREPEVDAPPLAAAHRILALTYEKEGRKAEAIAELQTALRLKPDFEAAKQDLRRLK